ncbi:hypothetical protein KFE98_16880 [bacterium SCSIO 12741]|nr:hypothetical protein KFE98_16880 [bacterium SCSIO 12741]
MSFFTRMGKGWSMGTASLKLIQKNKQLVLFPIISGIALGAVLATFFGFFYANWGFDYSEAMRQGTAADYALTFLFYLVCYFIIVFFNVGLVHCTRVYLQGGTPSFSTGVNYSMSRIPVILGWAMLSATVGLILKAIDEYGGILGSFFSMIVGVVWSIMTFFVVPILAYENVGPITALKQSGKIMKEKWGESIGASFSFGIFSFIGLLLVALPIGLLLGAINPIVGIVAGVLVFFLIQSIVSAAEMVFVAAVYHELVEEQPVAEFEGLALDDLFEAKKKKGLF